MRDVELLTGDPRWHNFLPGTSPLGLFFTGVEASEALSWDVCNSLSYKEQHLKWHSCRRSFILTIFDFVTFSNFLYLD